MLGSRAKGAAGAAYSTALEIEYCRVMGIKYSGGAADIYKCFDQVRRDIVYKLLHEAGMPRRVIHAYNSFQEALTVRNTVAGGLGQPFSKPTSIPQGDPMSMVVTSLLLRAWVKQMQRHGVTPRILADDLQLMCHGKDHLERFTLGFNKTFQHLEDLGGEVGTQQVHHLVVESSGEEMAGAAQVDETTWHHPGHHRWQRPGVPHERCRQEVRRGDVDKAYPEGG